MNNTGLNYDEVAQQYAQNRQAQPEVLKNLLTMGQLKADQQVLEVGCGTGNYIISIQKAVGCACWGVDPSTGMLSKARQRSARVDFQPGQAEDLPFPDNFFALLFSVDVIHHLSDHQSYFQGAYRVLRPGGRICTVTDSERIIRNRQPLSTYFPETVAFELKRYPPITHLRDIMAQSGFTEIIEEEVEFHYKLTDIQAYRDKAYSILHLLSEEDFQAGLERMEQDLLTGPIPCVSQYVLLWGIKP
jgi:ubiquinone/menaquinone biosynthesis C-methylase UbiE